MVLEYVWFSGPESLYRRWSTNYGDLWAILAALDPIFQTWGLIIPELSWMYEANWTLMGFLGALDSLLNGCEAICDSCYIASNKVYSSEWINSSTVKLLSSHLYAVVVGSRLLKMEQILHQTISRVWIQRAVPSCEIPSSCSCGGYQYMPVWIREWTGRATVWCTFRRRGPLLWCNVLLWRLWSLWPK